MVLDWQPIKTAGSLSVLVKTTAFFHHTEQSSPQSLFIPPLTFAGVALWSESFLFLMDLSRFFLVVFIYLFAEPNHNCIFDGVTAQSKHLHACMAVNHLPRTALSIVEKATMLCD